MAAATMSPSSSPRLPSPPPMAEDQLGPKSPISQTSEQDALLESKKIDREASRRIRPGTKRADIPDGPPLMDLAEIDTAFQLTEHLKALYNSAVHPTPDKTIPIDRPTATRLATIPKDVDRSLWLYELCRFLCQNVNSIVIALFAANPPCNAQSCNEMRASEWQYLCAVHDPPKPCCAIDYCCHTLDWAANLLTSPMSFPSRMAMSGIDTEAGSHQMRQLTNIYRRVYRIFAHAWSWHRDVFWKVEGPTGLYVFFKTVGDMYGLIPESNSNYTLPEEAEGPPPQPGYVENSKELTSNTTSLDPPSQRLEGEARSQSVRHNPLPSNSANMHNGTSNHTPGHRQNASVDMGTVVEEKEEEDGKQSALPAEGLDAAVAEARQQDEARPDAPINPTPESPATTVEVGDLGENEKRDGTTEEPELQTDGPAIESDSDVEPLDLVSKHEGEGPKEVDDPDIKAEVAKIPDSEATTEESLESGSVVEVKEIGEPSPEEAPNKELGST